MTKKKKNNKKAILPSIKEKSRKSVHIEQVDNGFVVRQSISTNNDYKEKQMVAKTEDEAKKIASNFL